jgi:small-conductance mechanosensitive channel
MTDVLLALGLALGGMVLGSIAAPITRRALASRSQPAIRDSAKGAGSFVFGLFCALGLVAALGVASPESLKPLPGDIARFLPRAVVAGLLIISGRIVATLVVAAVGRAMLKATGRQHKAILRTIEVVIVALVALVAAAQLGIDTTVLNIFVAAIAFGGALAMALLIGIGGRDTSREIAAGRSLARYLAVGDSIEIGEVSGTVTELQPTVIIVQTGTGEVVLTNTAAQAAPLHVSRIARDPTTD